MFRHPVFKVVGFLVVLAGALAAEIRPNEALEISISGVPEADRVDFNDTYPVSANGIINLPYIGQVAAAGLTPLELAERIENAYRKAEIYGNPTVNVKPVGDLRLGQKQLVVGGQVRRPGPVGYREGITLWQGIQAAGGDDEFAAVRRVQLHRGGRVEVFDLRENRAKHHVLQENDSVIVPQKRPFEGGW